MICIYLILYTEIEKEAVAKKKPGEKKKRQRCTEKNMTSSKVYVCLCVHAEREKERKKKQSKDFVIRDPIEGFSLYWCLFLDRTDLDY